MVFDLIEIYFYLVDLIVNKLWIYCKFFLGEVEFVGSVDVFDVGDYFRWVVMVC